MPTPDDRLHKLIDLYFEAATTDAEEAELKMLLADPALPSTPEADEARAVMGFTSLQKALRSTPAPGRMGRRPLVRIAAAAAILGGIALSTHLLLTRQHEPATYACVYINGHLVESTDEALAIMQAQLGAMGAAQSQSATAKALSALDSMLSPE